MPEAIKGTLPSSRHSGNYMDWVCNSNIQELSLKHNSCGFMPSGENFFYLDDGYGALYSEYIGKELVDFTRKMFPISEERMIHL